jgi:O-antigen/teichoic acid export membrane protein
MFALLFSLGTDALVIRDIARNTPNAWRLFGSAFWLRLFSFPLTTGLIMVGAWLAGYPSRDRHFILLIALAMGLSAASDLLRSAFQGLQRMELDAFSRSLEKVGTVLLALFFVTLAPRVESVAWAALSGALIGLLATRLILRRLVGRLALSHPRYSLSLLKETAPLAVSLALILLYQRLPVVILSWFRSYQEVGYYNAAFSITAPFTLLPMAFVGAIYPTLANLFQSDRPSVDRLHLSVLGYIVAFTLPLAVGISFLAGDVIRILYGAAFEPAAQALVILTVTIPAVFLTTYLTSVLIAVGDQKRLLPVTLFNLAISVATNLLLARRFGFPGSAIAAVLTECGGLALLLFFTARWVRHGVNRRLFAALLATGIMTVGLWFVRDTSIWIRFLLGAGLYLLGLWAAGGLTWRELQEVAGWVVTGLGRYRDSLRG